MKTKLMDILQKYVAPSVLGVITVDSYRRQVYSHKTEITQINKVNNEEIRRMQEELWGEKLVNSELKVKLEACSSRITDIEQKLSGVNSKFTEVETKLNTGNFSSYETVENLTNYKSYLSKEILKMEQTKDSLVKELQNNIDKSDIFSFISDFLENFKSFVDQLSLEQLVALFNIIGFGMVLGTLISISTLLIGDYLIDKLKLDIRYPKVSKYIRLKQSLNKHYLMFYMTMFYVIVIVFILVNLYMLFLKYFV